MIEDVSTEYIVCPHCGHYFRPTLFDNEDLFSYGVENECTCEKCGEKFLSQHLIIYVWTTRKLDE